MYLEFYKLKANPFQLAPDPRFFFGSSVHTKVKSYMTFGISQGEGFIVVTGDVGAGKTTLVAHLLSLLDPHRFRSARILTTQLGADDMLRMVAAGFGIACPEGADKAAIIQAIDTFFLERGRAGERCLLVVDEAQNLGVAALEELRMLSNLGSEAKPPLQTLLVGQPQFRRTLARPDLEQLRQRVVASCHLAPLGEDDVRDYVLHRLHQAGWRSDPVLAEGVFPAIYRRTLGVPRRINLLCSRLLLFGVLDQRHRLGDADVDQVADELASETEDVLDHSPPAEASEAAAGSSPGSSPGEARLAAVEARLQRQEKAWRHALLALSRYLAEMTAEEGRGE
jgi:general secretion pathway protein A